jgi:hypothetical protein
LSPAGARGLTTSARAFRATVRDVAAALATEPEVWSLPGGLPGQISKDRPRRGAPTLASRLHRLGVRHHERDHELNKTLGKS